MLMNLLRLFVLNEVNGALLKISISELQRLLFQVPNSTLTVWSNSGDPLAVDDLLVFRKAFGINQIVYDVPVSQAVILCPVSLFESTS
jgi:hypothetical protein